MIEAGSVAQWTRRLRRLSESIAATKKKGREAMRTFGSLSQSVVSGSSRGKAEPVVLVALTLLAAQAPTSAATRNSQPLAAPLSWRLAQAAPDSHPNAAAPTTPEEDKNKAEKAGVPATVVDGEQLEGVLGIEALSSTGEDMGRITDIIADRDGQVRAAIIDFGGFLGVGSRKIVVDWRSLHFDPKKAGAVVVNLTKDQLRVAPVYKTGEPVVVIGGPGAKP
jgi:PRC-barrel domain